MTRALWALWASVALVPFFALGCDSPPPTWDWERMLNQEHYRPYEASDLFVDGRAMRTPPAGVVPEERPIGDPLVTRGQKDGRYATTIPFPMTRDRLLRGRQRFDIFCAPCHGIRGDGESAVAERMVLRRPPPLAGPLSGNFPPGRIFAVISQGYGLMRPYAHDLSIEDRWAVVQYLRALSFAAGARVDDLPAPLRDRAGKELR